MNAGLVGEGQATAFDEECGALLDAVRAAIPVPPGVTPENAEQAMLCGAIQALVKRAGRDSQTMTVGTALHALGLAAGTFAAELSRDLLDTSAEMVADDVRLGAEMLWARHAMAQPASTKLDS